MTPAQRVAERRAEVAEQEIRATQTRLTRGPASAPTIVQEAALSLLRANLAMALEDLAAEQCPVDGCNNDSTPTDTHGHCLTHRHMYHHARRQA